MTTQEINQYIITKQIPISFIYNNCKVYLRIFDYSEYTSFLENYIDNQIKWIPYNSTGYTYKDCVIDCVDCNSGDKHFSITKLTMQECLGEFLFWFEINNYKCTQIEYYQK